MPSLLLKRQISLLKYLTSKAAIFNEVADAPIDRLLAGINGGLLHLEARFSHEKRMAKIEWVLPKTLELLGTARPATIRDFVEACPPVSISRIECARQFHAFLSERWRVEAAKPPYLPDVAASELAYASIRSGDRPVFDGKRHAGGVRRHPSVILIRSSYDIRLILEGRAGETAVAERDTPLAISMPPAAEHPNVSKLSSELFDLLEMLDDFVVLETLSNEVRQFMSDLEGRGLLEVRL
jgi:hypothetical protein